MVLEELTGMCGRLALCQEWKDARAVEWGGLENRYPVRDRRFESCSFRQKSFWSSENHLPRAMLTGKSRL